MKHSNLETLSLSENGILVYTDFWNLTAYKIKTLEYVLYSYTEKAEQKEFVLNSIDVTNCSKQELAEFFRSCGKLSIEFGNSLQDKHVQFSCITEEGERSPIKWFWIKVDHQRTVLGHDVAFDTVLLRKYVNKRSSYTIPLGAFFRKRLHTFKRVKEKQAKQAYKTIANFVFKK